MTHKIAYTTESGTFVQGKAEEVLTSAYATQYVGRVNLILTSPPFPLNRKKKYGNLNGEEYVEWLASFAPLFRRFLSPDGSIVMEMGNSWEPGRPVMSTLALKAMLRFLEHGKLFLCQQFVWNNPARLPSPAQWVNIERIRVKDAFTHIWWMAATDRPKASNRNVLTEYSSSMKRLLETGQYNAGRRPSEYVIGEESFLNDNKGAIPSNVLTYANTRPNTNYLDYCRLNGLTPHPARMPIELAEFFVKLLTNDGDLVLDPFAGSNTTGEACAKLGRSWLAIEPIESYIESSKGRFTNL